MNEDRKKFQELLRELFQFDCADLDFGIYRIMSQKRGLIEEFIEKDLLDAVGKELKKGALREQGDLAEQLAAQAEKVREIADDALDADGNLNPKYADTKPGKAYVELQAKAAGATSIADLEAQVFNHLWAFFSRYYDNGDFLSTRRYSRREKYAIPYNGEEVYVHWANRDQYYIKTGENFTDYQWKAGDVTVLFKLAQAETEKDNVKSDTKRLFVPRLDEVAVDKKLVTLPFEYRGLTEQEGITFGKKNQQEAIIAAALESLPKRKAMREAPAVLAAVMVEYRRTEKGESVSRLEHHLRRYTGKNTRDYFIHKDLEGFLTRELDFYLKNEVLALDDLAAGGAERAEGWFQLLEAIRAVGGKIIAFLAHIENFQKRVFEKRKFVTETHYCFTLDRVPKALWPQILKNKAQVEEWKRLYSIQDLKGYSDPLKPAFFEAYPSLMIDTRFFAADISFMDMLLVAQKDLEESLGGLLVHSENFQALNLMGARFKEGVKCVYIDPPFNTDARDFPYKDSFRHSSWVAMMADRLALAKVMMALDGVHFTHIGDDENQHVRLLLERVFPVRKNSVIVRRGIKNVQAQFKDIDRLNAGHDIIHVTTATHGVRLPHLRQSLATERPGKWDTFWRGTDRATMRYKLFGQKPEEGQWRWEEERGLQAKANYEYYLKHKAKDSTLDEWYVENLQAGVDLDFVRLNEEKVVQYYVPPQGARLVSDNWLDIPASGNFTSFLHEKSVELLQRVINWVSQEGDWVADYFAGSGSLGHACMALPASGEGPARRALMIEMGRYFDDTLLPRLKKLAFTSDWREDKPDLPKNGKSTGLSHAFKYIRLESYEDALGNISFEGPQGDLKFDDYVLRYMLGFETRKSETLLNVEKLAAPFSYQLDIMSISWRAASGKPRPWTCRRRSTTCSD